MQCSLTNLPIQILALISHSAVRMFHVAARVIKWFARNLLLSSKCDAQVVNYRCLRFATDSSLVQGVSGEPVSADFPDKQGRYRELAVLRAQMDGAGSAKALKQKPVIENSLND